MHDAAGTLETGFESARAVVCALTTALRVSNPAPAAIRARRKVRDLEPPLEPFIDALDRLLALIDRLGDCGIYLRHIDLGGGLGVRYRDEEPPLAGDYIKAVRERLGTGSPNTIHEHLKKWREARPVAAVAAPELPASLASALAEEIARVMDPVAKPMPLYPRKPQVVLVVGVNGSGKTTTIGKLASQFKAANKKVVIAAGDTFRAAAVEQLQVWGDRAGVPVLTAPEGSDPASLAFDAMTKAEADGADLLMIDTAGRLQNRADLMEELAKIVRVIRKVDATAPHNTLLVLDATTGQNAVTQVEIFRKIADVSGLVMTKLDGTAKGGVLVSLADKFGLPIHAIGIGEQIDDLSPFDPQEFARALVGLDD